jgi:hypothetical protein
MDLITRRNLVYIFVNPSIYVLTTDNPLIFQTEPLAGREILMSRLKMFTVLVILGALSVGWRSGDHSEQVLADPRNMSLQDTVLLVSDSFTGVHVFDVEDPSAPKRRYVIPLEGNRGSAKKGDVLYADDREAVYAIRLEPDTFTVVKKIVTFSYNEIFCGGVADGHSGFGCACSDNFESSPMSSGSTGSSYATFAVIGDYLYCFNYGELVTMDISTPDDPVELSRTPLSWTVETIYPTQSYLYLGGSRGMYIYSRRSPAKPVKVGQLVHARSCDPVVVSGRYAYVTLRGGNGCGQTDNDFIVVSVADPANPRLKSETPLPTPYGLAIHHPLVYVSSGYTGFRLIDVSDPTDPWIVASWLDVDTKDFIWDGDLLYVMSFKDVSVYDVSTPESPVLLSRIQ